MLHSQAGFVRYVLTTSMACNLSPTIHTYHNVRTVYQRIEEICGLHERQAAMANRYNWWVQTNSCQQLCNYSFKNIKSNQQINQEMKTSKHHVNDWRWHDTASVGWHTWWLQHNSQPFWFHWWSCKGRRCCWLYFGCDFWWRWRSLTVFFCVISSITTLTLP